MKRNGKFTFESNFWYKDMEQINLNKQPHDVVSLFHKMVEFDMI